MSFVCHDALFPIQAGSYFVYDVAFDAPIRASYNANRCLHHRSWTSRYRLCHCSCPQGLSVEIADGMKPPIDKACGEGLMPDTIAALAELGVHVPAADSAPLRGIRFIAESDAQGVSPTIRADFPAGPGCGVKRLQLHQFLLDRALELGVRFHWQTVTQGIEGDTILTNRGTMHAGYIVGADGHQSRVRTWAGLDRSAWSFLRPARRIGLRQHFEIAPWTSHVEVYWSRSGQAYVTPVSANEICVAFVASTRFSSVADSAHPVSATPVSPP